MCGRYVLVPGDGWVDMTGQQKRSTFEPNYNVAPTQEMPVVTSNGVETMKWGLVPSWSKEFRPAYTSINARAESVAEKPMYRTPFKKRRCLVPASGFYEWQKREDGKHPFLFTVNDRDMFYFAGLYDIWYSPTGEERKTYTIITTEANKVMSDVHDRMPVILEPSEEQEWIDESNEPGDLLVLLNPLADDLTHRHEVSADVGNVRNNHDGLLVEVNSA